MVIKWMKRLKWMRISKYALIITLLLSLVFAGFTVYGAKTGNFNIFLRGDDVFLSIYMKEDRSDEGDHLTVPTLDDMDNTTFSHLVNLRRNEIVPGLGPKNDEFSQQFLCFSFVLVNQSDIMVNYDMQLIITDSRRGSYGGRVVSALRVLVFEEKDYVNGEPSEYETLRTEEEQKEFFQSGEIYALAETEEEKALLQERLEEKYLAYDTKDFISETQIFWEKRLDFAAKAEIKYTFVMWLEGCDKDCVNDLYGGKIKMRLDIHGY